MGPVDADYLVVGAGAAGMAFTDALVAHKGSARVVMVDRRHGVGGHWLDAYPFVRLHQASAFYGVASTLLGGGRLQTSGPEAGLQERANVAEIRAYFVRVLEETLLATGRVEFFPACDYLGHGTFASLVSGKRLSVRAGCRVVDARYLAPTIPATTRPPFPVADDVRSRIVPVNDLVHLDAAPSSFVIVGSGKTATDAVIWLLENGVDPDAICWVRPRDPWMLNRAVVQPDPAVFLAMAADTMEIAAGAASADAMFLGLEEAGIMLRIDKSVTPTMAKTPTLAKWELDKLRTIENVVRRGHIRGIERTMISCTDGDIPLASGALVVHCAASGLQYPDPAPIWGTDAITIQPVRAGFPCFGAALVGFVEATRDDDTEKNRLCPPTPYSNTTSDWSAMQVLGARASAAFSAEPDIKAWVDTLALNPARTPPHELARPEVNAAVERYRELAGAGLARLAQFAGLPG